MTIISLLALALPATGDIYAERTIAVLTNNTKFRRIAGQIHSFRILRILEQVYMQCAAGFRDVETDPACRKIAIIMIQNHLYTPE